MISWPVIFIFTVCIRAIISAGPPEAIHGHLALDSTGEFKSNCTNFLRYAKGSRLEC